MHDCWSCCDFAPPARLLTSSLPRSTTGHICADEWVYHTVNATQADTEKHLRFVIAAEGVEANSASFYVLPRDQHAPERLAPPFAILSGTDTAEATLCASERSSLGGRAWLGIFTGSTSPCVDYKLRAELFTGHCDRMPHLESSGDDGAVELPVSSAVLGSCEANSWADYRIELTQHERDANNVLFEARLFV